MERPFNILIGSALLIAKYIITFDVPGNKVKGKVSKDADINRILKKYLHEHDKELKVIKKALKA